MSLPPQKVARSLIEIKIVWFRGRAEHYKKQQNIASLNNDPIKAEVAKGKAFAFDLCAYELEYALRQFDLKHVPRKKKPAP